VASSNLSQHPDEHRPQRPILLAVDEQLGEGARRRFPSYISRRARHKPELASQPLPSRIHEQREHHQPRDDRYVNRDYLPRPQQFVHADLCPHGDKTPHGERDNERRRVARINLFIVPPSLRPLSYLPRFLATYLRAPPAASGRFSSGCCGRRSADARRILVTRRRSSCSCYWSGSQPTLMPSPSRSRRSSIKYAVRGRGENVRVTYLMQPAGLVHETVTLPWMSREFEGPKNFEFIRLEADGPQGQGSNFPQYAPIASARSKSGSIRTWSSSARGAGPRASRRSRRRRSSWSGLIVGGYVHNPHTAESCYDG
jgi:hypothetical protein